MQVYVYSYKYTYICECMYMFWCVRVCVCLQLCVCHRSIGIGWLRLVGPLQIWVSFAKEPYKRDYILQKRHVILRSLLIGKS